MRVSVPHRKEGDDARHMVFSCTWDRYVQIRTRVFILMGALAVAYLVGVGVALMITGIGAGVILALLGIAISGIGLVRPAYCAPLRYVLTQSELIVERRWHRVIIPLKDIAEVKTATYDDVFRGATGGSTAAGMFGMVGHFYGLHGPEFYAYATRKDNLVLVALKKKESHGCRFLVLSPDDQYGFIQRIELAHSN